MLMKGSSIDFKSILTSSTSYSYLFLWLVISKALSIDQSDWIKGLDVYISAVLHFTRKSLVLLLEWNPDQTE